MTILQCLAIRDVKIEAFNRPWFSPTLGAAHRAFTDAVQSPDAQNEMIKHPADFGLYHLGTYNDETGLLTPLPQPNLIAEAISCVNQGNT